MKYIKYIISVTLIFYLLFTIIFHFNDTYHFLDIKIASSTNVLTDSNGLFYITDDYIYSNEGKTFIYILENTNTVLYNKKICIRYEIQKNDQLFHLLNSDVKRFTVVKLSRPNLSNHKYFLY